MTTIDLIEEMRSIEGHEKLQAAGHVLVIPIAAQGHMAPALYLAKQLSCRGITITLTSYEDEISRLTSGDSSSDLQSLGFRFVSLENPRPAPAKSFTLTESSKRLEEAFRPLMEKLVQDKISGVAGPTSILSDFFLPWTQDAADKLQIPRYVLMSSFNLARTFQGFRDLFGGQVKISTTDGNLAKFDGPVFFPGLPPLYYHDLPFSVRQHTPFLIVVCKSVWQSAGILVKSFFELEEKAIETWRKPGNPGYEHTKVPKIYPIGPLFSTSAIAPRIAAVGGLEDSAEKSILWLGSQPFRSVLYVAFGSQFRLSAGQIKELALGLEGSKQRFLWVIPKSKGSSEEGTPSISDVLPPGFEARVGDRGCVVTGWVPQMRILAHSSTAGFLTHSGWNGTQESIMMGVPMISWPQGAEQYLNRRFLVDDLKVAIELQTGDENIASQVEVERAVRLLMVGSEGKEIRRRVEEFQRKGAAAVGQGGSQSKILGELLDDMSKLNVSKIL